jgi:hypothetical protein
MDCKHCKKETLLIKKAEECRPENVGERELAGEHEGADHRLASHCALQWPQGLAEESMEVGLQGVGLDVQPRQQRKGINSKMIDGPYMFVSTMLANWRGNNFLSNVNASQLNEVSKTNRGRLLLLLGHLALPFARLAHFHEANKKEGRKLEAAEQSQLQRIIK